MVGKCYKYYRNYILPSICISILWKLDNWIYSLRISNFWSRNFNWNYSLLSKYFLWRIINLDNMILTFEATAAAAKSLQLCLTLCDPIDGSPPGSPVPRILQARTLEWVAIAFSNAWKWKVKVKSLSRVPLLATPWTAAYQPPLSMGFSRQEYWSGVPSPSPTLPPNMFVFGNTFWR